MLRKALLEIARTRPEMRPHLIPLLRQSSEAK